VVVVVTGAVVGRALEINEHPHGQRIWLTSVDLGWMRVQIVFGGDHIVEVDDLVPVAPPGALVQVRPSDLNLPPRIKKMRARNFRGQRSHGMLCSLDELGWSVGGPDEVAVLRGLRPGDCLHSLSVNERVRYVERPDILQLADVPAERAARTGQRVTK